MSGPGGGWGGNPIHTTLPQNPKTHNCTLQGPDTAGMSVRFQTLVLRITVLQMNETELVTLRSARLQQKMSFFSISRCLFVRLK